MLPSSGYFKSAICPFFKSGLCERPNCHFKHDLSDVNFSGTSSASWSAPDIIELPVVKKENVIDIITLDESNYETILPQSIVSPPSYQPTPVVKPQPAGILKVTTVKTEPIPEYKPTPISQLNQLNNNDKPLFQEVVFVQSTAPRKRKKFTEEYVPEIVKRPTGRKVKFNLPDEDNEDILEVNNSSPVIVLDSDDEENGETIDAAFSDDEEIEEPVKVKQENVVIEFPVEEENNETNFVTGSLVDQILGDVKKNEEYIRSFRKPSKNINNNKTVQPTSSDLDFIRIKQEPKETIVKTEPNSRELKQKELNIEPESIKNKETSEKSILKKSSLKLKNDENTKKPSEKTNIKLHSNVKSHKESSSASDNKHTKHESKTSVTNKEKTSKSKSTSHDSKEKSKSSESIKKSTNSSDVNKHKTSKSSTHHQDKLKLETKSHKSDKSKTEHKAHTSVSGVKPTKTDKHLKSSSSSGTKHHKNEGSSNKRDHQKSEKRKLESSAGNDLKKIKVSSKSNTFTEKSKIQDRKVSSSSVVSKKVKSESSKHHIKKHPHETETVKHAHTKSHHSSVPSSKHDKSEQKSSSDVTELLKTNVPEETASEDSDSDRYEDASFLMNSDDDDEEDVEKECWRIFQESVSNAPVVENGDETTNEERVEHNATSSALNSLTFCGKKRVAHQVQFQREKVHTIKPAKAMNPTEVMLNRYKKLQEMHAKQSETKEPSLFFNPHLITSSGQKIPSVSNSPLLNAVLQKNKLSLSTSNSSNVSSDPTTRVASSIKEKKRISHIPTVATKPRPIIPIGCGNKVASNIRQKYLNLFIDECLKFCLTEDEAYDMGLEEEKTAYDRCSSKTVYMNVAANTLNRLRHRAREGPKHTSSTVSSTTSSEPLRKKLSHQAILAGPKSQNISYSIERRKFKPPEIEIKGSLLYSSLKKYVLTEEQLVQHGFPLPHPVEPGRAVISGIYVHKYPAAASDTSKRTCSRCQKTYYVDANGDYVKQEECDFHWGRLYKKRIAGQFEARYTCCASDAESDGCCVGPGHVFDGFDNFMLKGFVKTLPKTPPIDKYYGVYSLDCEMCYTTVGIELTRITVINPDMKPAYETLVKPEHRILDYNTRFSGIREEDLIGVTTSIRDVQAAMLTMFNDKTILIGHSLESDLKALKIIHKTVVDTSVVFPHKLGLPYKRGLRTLMAEKCNKIIQNSTEGHDSHEDAAACMELMLWRLKEDAKSPR